MTQAKLQFNIDPPIYWKMTPKELLYLHNYQSGAMVDPFGGMTREKLESMKDKWADKLR